MTDSDEIFMEELKQEFKETVAQHIVDLPKLFSKGNLEQIARIAHDIKGTSGVFGYDEGTDIAKDLQYAAQENDADKTGQLIQMLADYMKKQGIV